MFGADRDAFLIYKRVGAYCFLTCAIMLRIFGSCSCDLLLKQQTDFSLLTTLSQTNQAVVCGTVSHLNDAFCEKDLLLYIKMVTLGGSKI